MYDDLFKGIEEIIRGISSQVELTFSTIQSNDALNRFAEQVKNYLLELQKDENLSREEYEAKYANEKATAEELGKAGWVITQHSNPHDVGEWKDILYSSDSKSIELVFLGENEYILSSIVRELNDLYDNDEGLYYKKGIEFFEGEDYMTAAMYLTCQIDYRCKKLIDFGNSKKTRDIFSTRGFRDHLQREFSDEKGSITKKYLFLDMYPSLITFPPF